MPWHIERREGRYCVIKDDDDDNEGCHDSREEAVQQMRALYAAENRAASFSTESWDGSESRWPDAASYCRSAMVDNNPAGTEKKKSECHFPIRAPGSTAINVNALKAIVGGRGAQANFSGAEAARAKARRLLDQYNSSQDRSENRSDVKEIAPIESRAASVGSVDFPKREIEVLAVPYGQWADIEYRGDIWKETFDRGSFDGVELRTNRIKVYRDHDPSDGKVKSGLIGKTVALWPDRDEGLTGAVRIAKTPLGDETLALADEGVLGVSVGFGVRNRDQILDRNRRTRRISKAFLDHLAFPDEGAYEGAGVLAVRRAVDLPPRPETPLLDDVVAWMESRRASR